MAALHAGAAAYIVLFVLAAVLRLGYPFPLELTEPASLAEARDNSNHFYAWKAAWTPEAQVFVPPDR